MQALWGAAMTAYVLTAQHIATMTAPQGYGMIADGAIAIEGQRLAWVGPAAKLPAAYAALPRHDFGARLITPALLDCHTHIVHAGHRAQEFEMRLNGASYAQIARAGGGIISTVTATRAATESELLASALPRLDALIAQGVGTVEVKSGYGLDIDSEVKMLRAARALGQARAVRVKTTFLGAHAIPAGQTADSYIDDICIPALRAAHAQGLVDAVDGFCENIAFTAAQIARVFDVARALGLPVKLHAEQLSHSDGAALAARYRALSADHLEYARAEDAAKLAQAGTVAVLLPGAFYAIHETQAPPIADLRRHGVAMAVATDWNPGSSPLGSILLAMNMACTLFGLTPAEALAGTTRHAARALGLDDCGEIRAGLRADVAIWDAQDPAQLSYGIGINLLSARIFEGIL
jgi:imidazolonepropionase